MRRRIENLLQIQVDGIDLTTVSNIEVYVKQISFFKQYTPQNITENTMLVDIPLQDAMQMKTGTASIQFAFVDADGNPRASEITEVPVSELLKEAGYDPA